MARQETRVDEPRQGRQGPCDAPSADRTCLVKKNMPVPIESVSSPTPSQSIVMNKLSMLSIGGNASISPVRGVLRRRSCRQSTQTEGQLSSSRVRDDGEQNMSYLRRVQSDGLSITRGKRLWAPRLRAASGKHRSIKLSHARKVPIAVTPTIAQVTRLVTASRLSGVHYRLVLTSAAAVADN